MCAFLLIVQILVAVSLIGVILMQRSEGGGLGVGGSSSGFMTARGGAGFLTRATAILRGAVLVLSVGMGGSGGATREPVKIDTSLANTAVPVDTSKPVPAQRTAPAQPQQQNQGAPAVPLAQ